LGIVADNAAGLTHVRHLPCLLSTNLAPRMQSLSDEGEDAADGAAASGRD